MAIVPVSCKQFFRSSYSALILIGLPAAFIVSRPLIDGLVHDAPRPTLRVGASIADAALFLAVLFVIGRCLEHLIGDDRQRAVPSHIDATLLGLFWVTAAGVTAGILGILWPLPYALLVLAPILYALYRKITLNVNLGLPKDHMVLFVYICLIVSPIFFILHYIINDMALKGDIDYIFQYYFISDSILNCRALCPSIWAGENKIHEYYYSVAMGLPFSIPGTPEGLSLLGLALQVFIPVVAFAGLLRLMPNWAAAAGAVYFSIVFVGMTFGEHSNTIIKFNMRFMLLCYAVAGIYCILAAKTRHINHFLIATFAAGFLAGTTVVGMFAALPYFCFLLICRLQKFISRRSFITYFGIAALLAIIPKAINFAAAGTPLDYTTTILLKLWNREFFDALPQFYSNLDRYIYSWWYENPSANKPNLNILSVLINYVGQLGGGILLISAIIDWRNRKKDYFRVAAICFEIHALIALAASTSISFRHSIFFIPAYAWAVGNVYTAFGTYLQTRWWQRAGDTSKAKLLWCAAAIGCFLLVLGDRRGREFLWRNPPVPILEVLRIRDAYKNVSTAEKFFKSKEYYENHNLFKKGEPVFVIAHYRPRYPFIYRFYDYRPIFYTNALNSVLYQGKLQDVVARLKRLKIRYFLLQTKLIPLPRPELLVPSVASRYLRLVRSTALIPDLGEEQVVDHEVLFELRDKPLRVGNPDIAALLSRYEFNQNSVALAALKEMKLDEEVITRLLAPRR